MALEGFPQVMTLRDGTVITVRPMEAEDGPGLLEFFRSLPDEDRLFLKEDVTRPETIDRFVKGLNYDSVIPLLAFHEGRVVGDATLHRRSGWSKHVGEIRVVVARAFQKKGLGAALAKSLVGLALNLGLDKLVAEVTDHQIGARKAFEKIGFRQEAVLKDHVKDVLGSKRDLVLMTNDVSHIWESLQALAEEYLPTVE